MNSVNPYALAAIVGGIALAAFAVFVKASQSSARDAGAAEANAEHAKEDLEKAVEANAKLQEAEIEVAAERDPAYGIERLHAGTA